MKCAPASRFRRLRLRAKRDLAGGMRRHYAVEAIGIRRLGQVERMTFGLLLAIRLTILLPASAMGMISANLTWVASTDSTVTGYDIYYGGANNQYTNNFIVGDVTNATIPGLAENTVYFFGAKARNSMGSESGFSNEAAFAGFTARVGIALQLRTAPQGLSTDPFQFSLDASAPPGATINPTNGIISWTPGIAYASTTNFLNVAIVDPANPAFSISETVEVLIGDYLAVQAGALAVSAGQPGSLPLTLTASSPVTNVQVTLNWPTGTLLNPTLGIASPFISGSLQSQNNQLVIALQTAPGQPFTGSGQVAQVNFRTLSAPTTVILSIPAAAAPGNAPAGTAYANAQAQAGEVVVVGAQPLLRPQTTAGGGRTLSLYANPGSYELQATASLAAPVTWTTLTMCQLTNAAQRVALDAANPIIFYRLRQL